MKFKVGDLVKCQYHDDEIGVIVRKKDTLFYVWIFNGVIAFFSHQLEVIA
jgi:hypothetical protein